MVYFFVDIADKYYTFVSSLIVSTDNIWQGQEMTETQNTSEQNSRSAEIAILRIECDPSLKKDLRAGLVEAGFSSLSDCVKTLVRDFVGRRIQYRGGLLISQQKIA